MNDAARYMTKIQAANYLTVSQRTLDYMTQRGEIPCIRFGGRVMFDQVKLDAVMQQHEVKIGGAK